MKAETLFLHYAWPCAEGRLMRHLITETEYRELERIIETDKKITRSLLRRCFPEAYVSLRQYAKLQQLPFWSLDTVTGYWHEHHGHEGDCRVLEARIVATPVPEYALVQTAEAKFNALNIYCLPLEPGMAVYVHRRVIVEVKP